MKILAIGEEYEAARWVVGDIGLDESLQHTILPKLDGKWMSIPIDPSVQDEILLRLEGRLQRMSEQADSDRNKIDAMARGGIGLARKIRSTCGL